MLREGYNVQFEGTIVRTAQESTSLRDGGVQRDQGWSWIMCFAAFLTLCITNGMHASFGVLYAAFISHFDSGREETAWVGSISLGLLCFFSPVASVLIEQIGCRATSIIGAFLCSLGFFITSFASGIALLYFSHGLLFGLGTSLTYTAAMTVVGRSFERRRSIATGLCTSGSQFGGISLAPLSQVLFDRLGYANTFRTFAGLLLVVALSSLAYRSDLSRNTSRPSSAKRSPREMLSVWKSKAYIVWALSTTLVTLGYNIPRYTLAKYAIDQGISSDASAWLLSYLCASSAIGRITFGRLCEWVSKLYLCQACIIGCAMSAFLYPFLKSYLGLVITCIIFGLPDGGFVASLSMVTTEIVGPEKMVEGFGFMLFCQSYSSVIGPPLSGMLYDTYKSYKAAFCFAAVPETIGALMLFLIPYYRRNEVKYTHEIEYDSNSGILVNANGATSTLNPISDLHILSPSDPQPEYNVVINLKSDNPDVRFVNVVIHKTGCSEPTGMACVGGEVENANKGGIVNKTDGDMDATSSVGDIPLHISTRVTEGTDVVEQPSPEAQVSSVVIANTVPETNVVCALSSLKSSSTQTVIHGANMGIKYANNVTNSLNADLPAQKNVAATPENENQIIDVEISAPTPLVVIASNESHSNEVTDITNQGEKGKGSDICLHLATKSRTSMVQVAPNTLPLSEGHENRGQGTLHLQIEQDVPKISPPPQHKHHANIPNAEMHHVANADVNIACHDSVVDNSPEEILADLATLVQGSGQPTNAGLATSFTPDGHDKQASLMKSTGLETRLAGFTPEPGIGQNPESLMLPTNLIPSITSPSLANAFPTECSHMTGFNDVLTYQQLPEPLKPTSVCSVGGNEQQGNQGHDLPPATSPLSCALSTVIADVIQSLTSQQSSLPKSNKESTISNMADISQCNLEKKQDAAVENVSLKESKVGINVEPSSQPSCELSSYSKLQTSVLHSMQNIVAEGCPEDVALLEDISIDLTLDKDPSYDSIVIIDDVDLQDDATVVSVPSVSREPSNLKASMTSGHEIDALANDFRKTRLSHESTLATLNQTVFYASNDPNKDQDLNVSNDDVSMITSNAVFDKLLDPDHHVEKNVVDNPTYEPMTASSVFSSLQESALTASSSGNQNHVTDILAQECLFSTDVSSDATIIPDVISSQQQSCSVISNQQEQCSVISSQQDPCSFISMQQQSNVTPFSLNQLQASGIVSQERQDGSTLTYEPTVTIAPNSVSSDQHELTPTNFSLSQTTTVAISSETKGIEQHSVVALKSEPIIIPDVISSQQPSLNMHHSPATTTLPQDSDILGQDHYIKENVGTRLTNKPPITASVISNEQEPIITASSANQTQDSVILSQEQHEPTMTPSSVNESQPGGILCPEQHIQHHLVHDLILKPADVLNVVSGELEVIGSVILNQEKHFSNIAQETATAPSQEQQSILGIVSSTIVSHNQEPVHEVNKTHGDTFLAQELQFPGEAHGYGGTNFEAIPTQRQRFASVAKEATVTLSDEARQNIPSLAQELTILHGSASMILQDALVLELLPQTERRDGTVFDATKPHEKLTKPFEPTNPFYQDINQ